MADTYYVGISNASNVWVDTTEYVDIDALGEITWAVEDDLTQFRTGDVTIVGLDVGDFWTGLFATAAPDQTWQLKLQRNGITYFTGIIFFAGGVKFNSFEHTWEITALGLSKLLESTKAENLSRTFQLTTASIPLNSTIMTVDSTASLMALDSLSVFMDADTETFEVASVTDATHLVVTRKSGRLWSGASCICTTQYYRNKTPLWLAQTLLTAAGFTVQTIDISGSNFPLPIATSLNAAIIGAIVPGAISLTQVGGRIRARTIDKLQDAPGVHTAVEYDTADATNGVWSTLATGAMVGKVDGTSIPTWLAPIHDYTTSYGGIPTTYVTSPRTMITPSDIFVFGGVDYEASPPVRYGLYIKWVGSTSQFYLWVESWSTIYKDWNGLYAWYLIDTQTIPYGGSPYYVNYGASFSGSERRMYFAWAVNAGGTNRCGYIHVDSKVVTFITGIDDSGMMIGAASINMTLKYHWDTGLIYGIQNAAVRFYANTGQKYIRMQTARFHTGMSKWVALQLYNGTTYLICADPLWADVKRIRITDSASRVLTGSAAGTGVDNGDMLTDSQNMLSNFGTHVIGRANGLYIIVDDLYTGVVPYADWSGQSCADAIADLAKLLNCVVFVDVGGRIYFVARSSSVVGSPVNITGGVLVEDTDLCYEQWLGKVVIHGMGGITSTILSDKAQGKPISISTQLVNNLSIADSLAYAYQTYFSKKRREKRVDIVDDGVTTYYPIQTAIISGVNYTIYEVRYNLGERQVSFRLVEKVA
jgi:hypothetical protein